MTNKIGEKKRQQK